MDTSDELDAFAKAVAEAGAKLAVAKPANLDEATSLLRELGRDLITAARSLGYDSGGGRFEKIKKIVED
jgi:hypothetical protein